MKVLIGLVLFGVGLGIAAPATAQECSEGREATELSQGRCCWPGQGWSEAYGRCSGPPTCPAGLVGEGDDCIHPVSPPPAAVAPPAPPAAVAPVVPAAPATPTVSWAVGPDPRPRGGLNPALSPAPDEGWMVFGGISLATGWVFSIVIGSTLGLGQSRCSAEGAYAFIPVIGGLLHVAALDACADHINDPSDLLGPYLPAAVAQLAGAVALLAALIAQDAESLILETLTFSVPGADVGVGVHATF